MDQMLENYREAIRRAIEESHAEGIPVFQAKGGYIVAIYPGGREVKLHRVHDLGGKTPNGNDHSDARLARGSKRGR